MSHKNRQSNRTGRENYKVRVDSRLKTLPAPRQAALFEFLQTHGIKQAVEDLRADGLKTSPAAVSRFRAWYERNQQPKFEETSVLLEGLRRNIDRHKFQHLQDVGQWYEDKLRQERARLEAEFCRKLLFAETDEFSGFVASMAIPRPAKLQLLRRRYFGDKTDPLRAAA